MLDKLVVVSTLVKSDDINPRASDSYPTDSTRHVYQTIFCLILNIYIQGATLYTVEMPPGLGRGIPFLRHW